ncbi:hypothetical protein [Mycoplana sp. MJR14]|uniref:hypothetical protein n=1 Tax=Mycoplana sp. MJR14 TaxID=3032583 RepID=UPI000DDC18B8|nr:hypothetical protein [Mycoplana sp. MJR14]
MIPSHQKLNVHYDPASRTALLQCGKRSKVLRDLPTRQRAEDAARAFACDNWGYVDRQEDDLPDGPHPAGTA